MEATGRRFSGLTFAPGLCRGRRLRLTQSCGGLSMQRTKWAYHGACLVSLVVAMGGRAAAPSDYGAEPPGAAETPGLGLDPAARPVADLLARNEAPAPDNDRPPSNGGGSGGSGGPAGLLERALTGSQVLERP